MNATKTEVVDDGRRSNRLGRMRTPRRRREELLAEYERSGLSQAAFARRAGVRYPTFAHWVQKRRRVDGIGAETPAAPSSARFVELRLPARCAPHIHPVQSQTLYRVIQLFFEALNFASDCRISPLTEKPEKPRLGAIPL